MPCFDRWSSGPNEASVERAQFSERRQGSDWKGESIPEEILGNLRGKEDLRESMSLSRSQTCCCTSSVRSHAFQLRARPACPTPTPVRTTHRRGLITVNIDQSLLSKKNSFRAYGNNPYGSLGGVIAGNSRRGGKRQTNTTACRG